jgi:hypothetical protein
MVENAPRERKETMIRLVKLGIFHSSPRKFS